MQVVKLWWMAFWRISLIGIFFQAFDQPVAFFAALIMALITRFGFGYTVKTWPLIRLAFRTEVLEPMRYTGLIASENPTVSKQAPKQASNQNLQPVPYKDPIRTPQVWDIAAHTDRQYAAGERTGYEPRILESVQIPKTLKMRGNPGQGLDASNFSETSISLGKKGEINFAKALTLSLHRSGTPLIETVDSFWSVAMPSKTVAGQKDPDYSSDIDCIIVSHDCIYLIDVKFYKSGNVFYESEGDELFCIDKATRFPVGSTKIMSKNMQAAHARFTDLYPKLKIHSRVVFVPTDNGIPQVEGVFWPGGIPAVGLMGMLTELSTLEPSWKSSEGRTAAREIEKLLK